MGKYFGTDGFRGEANVGLTAEHAYKIGRFLGWYYNCRYKEKGDKKTAEIVIGKDTRRSGYMLEYAIVSGIVSSGANAYLLHVTTTPCVAYVTKTENFDCGVMISASHNPFYDNGIKLINSKGEKLEDEVITLIESYLDDEPDFLNNGSEIPFGVRENIGFAVDYLTGRNSYISYLVNSVSVSFKGRRIGLDCANGSAWNIAREVFEALGAEVYVINASPDGININCDSGSTHPEALQLLVSEKKLDAGFAFDGDADRCLCVDEKGSIVDGDGILYICASHMKEKCELACDKVVTTVMTNLGLYKALEKLGISCAVTDVGDRYVYEYMAKNNCSLGGEQSGHIIFMKDASTGDGILTALKVMEVILSEQKTLSELVSPFSTYPQTLLNVKVGDKDKILKNESVQEKISNAVLILGDSGRLLVRKSGTEPVIRVMVEAETKEKCDTIANDIVKAITLADK